MAKPKKRFEDSMMQEAYEKGYLSPYPNIVDPRDQSRETWQRDYPEFEWSWDRPRPTHWDDQTRRPDPNYHAESYVVPGQRELFEGSPRYLQEQKNLQEQEAKLGQIRSKMLSPEEARRRSIEEMDRFDEARKQLVLHPPTPVGAWRNRPTNKVMENRRMLAAQEAQAMKEAEDAARYLGGSGRSNLFSGEMSAYHGLREQDSDALYDLFESQQAPEALRRPQLAPELTLREQEEQAYWEGSELGQIKYDEGFKPKVYKDSVKIDTIGYGFNLERPEAQAELDHAGINKTVADLRSGKKSLTEAEADLLIRSEVPKFESAAVNFVGEETWNSLPKDKQNVLTNMAFNLGSTRLNKFNNLRDALQAGDYEKAKDEMYKSTWREQVKSRATRLMDRMAAPDPYAMNPAPGYDIRNLFDDMGREDFDVGSAIEDALRRRG